MKCYIVYVYESGLHSTPAVVFLDKKKAEDYLEKQRRCSISESCINYGSCQNWIMEVDFIGDTP